MSRFSTSNQPSRGADAGGCRQKGPHHSSSCRWLALSSLNAYYGRTAYLRQRLYNMPQRKMDQSLLKQERTHASRMDALDADLDADLTDWSDGRSGTCSGFCRFIFKQASGRCLTFYKRSSHLLVSLFLQVLFALLYCVFADASGSLSHNYFALVLVIVVQVVQVAVLVLTNYWLMLFVQDPSRVVSLSETWLHYLGNAVAYSGIYCVLALVIGRESFSHDGFLEQSDIDRDGEFAES